MLTFWDTTSLLARQIIEANEEAQQLELYRNDYEALLKEIKGYENELSIKESSLEDLQDWLEEEKEKLLTLKNKESNLIKQINACKNILKDFPKKNDTQESFDELENDLFHLKADISDADDDITVSESDISLTENEIEGIENRLSILYEIQNYHE